MRDLISRKQAIQRMIEEIEVSKKNVIHINEIKRLLQDVDTIEAVPVVHGEWIRNENLIEVSCECSICHAKDYWYDIDKANEYYWFHRKLCPNCGADMRKGGAK